MIFDVIFTVFKLVHPKNVPCSIEVTLDGIVIDINDPHSLNAPNPIDVTDFGMVIDVRLLHSLKALIPIDVIFDAMFTVFKLIQ